MVGRETLGGVMIITSAWLRDMIRRFVPASIGAVVALVLNHVALHLSSSWVAVIVAAVSVVWSGIVTKAEKRWPWVAFLIGALAQAKYEAVPVAKPVPTQPAQLVTSTESVTQ